MAKKNQDCKQQRQQEKQRRLDTVRQKTAELGLRVPKLCRTDTLTELCRDFYRLTGVDLFIGVPANVKNGPQNDRITVPPGAEVQVLGTQLMQMYAVCVNAAMKNACNNGNYKLSSLELLLEACSAEEQEQWGGFLRFINLARQFFCHYTYLWPNAVPERTANELKHYLDLSTMSDNGKSDNDKSDNDKSDNGKKSYWWPDLGQVNSENNGWLRLQDAVALTADEFYAWLQRTAAARGGEPMSLESWKHKISVLYQPTDMEDKFKRNWFAPIDWKWKQMEQISQINHGHGDGGSTGKKYDKTALMKTLNDRIQNRESGRPGAGEEFTFLQDMIYAWAAWKLGFRKRSDTHVNLESHQYGMKQSRQD